MDRTLLLIPTALRPDNLLGFHIPGLGVILTFTLLIATGSLAANFFGRSSWTPGRRSWRASLW